MSNHGYLRLDRTIDVLCQTFIVLGSIVIVAMALSACTADKDRSRAIDLAVKGAYSVPPGDANQTRNQPPHGGIDEKSDTTPTKPQ